jgi:putative ABC transport system permease protein
VHLVLSALWLALRTIYRSKLRAALTILGILIGVAAVVVVTALGTGVRERIGQQVEDLGSNTIYVFAQPTQVSGAKNKGLGRITETDGRAMVREATSLSAVAPFSSTQSQVVYGDRNVATSIMGSTRDYFVVRKFPIARGSLWTEQDERLKAKVVVLGTTVSEALFGNQDPIGAVIRIGRYPYRVIALMEKKGPSPFGEDQDDRILMPSTTFRARIRPSGIDRVDMLIASATSALTVDRAQAQIESILRQRHGISDQDQADFRCSTQNEIRQSQEAIFGVLSVLLISIAAVSLFVGGIGVMNIMLVSVTERTREIGIRMAIGAREADILFQFLIEAVVLSLLGGIIGSAFGSAAILIASRLLEWPMRLPIEALLVALGTSAGIGILFGFLPARRAARLDPIEALRQD